MRQRITAYLLAGAAALSLFGAAALAAEPARTPDAGRAEAVQTGGEAAPASGAPVSRSPGAVSFADLSGLVRTGNLSCLMLEERIALIEEMDYDKMEEELRDGMNAAAAQQVGLMAAPAGITSAIPGLGASTSAAIQAVGALSATATSMSLQAQYDALREKYDDLKEGKTQADYADMARQLRDTQDSMVKMAESLYVQIKELDAADVTMARKQAALDRTIQELELRLELGQVSDLTLQQAKTGRVSLVSGRQTAASGARTLRMTLASLLGEDLSGELELNALPQVTGEQLSRMDLEADLAAAKEASYTLYDAKKTWDDAQKKFKDRWGGEDFFDKSNKEFIQDRHTWQAAGYTYEAAVQSFELSFRTLYGQIQDYRQVLEAAQAALAQEKENCAVDQLKFEQGTISQNALLTARDKVSDARDAADTAERNLFTAYNNYRWAVEHGVLN